MVNFIPQKHLDLGNIVLKPCLNSVGKSDEFD